MRLQSAIADQRRRPGIHTPCGGYGFRARSFGTKLTSVNFVPNERPGMTLSLSLSTVACSAHRTFNQHFDQLRAGAAERRLQRRPQIFCFGNADRLEPEIG